MDETSLTSAARLLGDLADELVFVGGGTVAYWIEQHGRLSPRITLDVDSVLDVTTKAAYDRFGDRLRDRGFEVDSASRVIVRWVHKDERLVLDVMPVSADVFGFGGGWQAEALQHPRAVEVGGGRTLRVASPPYLIAMKLEAFLSRGRSDLMGSHDFEDLVLLLAAFDDLPEQFESEDESLIGYVANELKKIQDHPRYEYAIQGVFAQYEDSQHLADKVRDRRIPELVAYGRSNN